MINRNAVKLVAEAIMKKNTGRPSDIDIRLAADAFAFMDFWDEAHTYEVRVFIIKSRHKRQ